MTNHSMRKYFGDLLKHTPVQRGGLVIIDDNARRPSQGSLHGSSSTPSLQDMIHQGSRRVASEGSMALVSDGCSSSNASLEGSTRWHSLDTTMQDPSSEFLERPERRKSDEIVTTSDFYLSPFSMDDDKSPRKKTLRRVNEALQLVANDDDLLLSPFKYQSEEP